MTPWNRVSPRRNSDLCSNSGVEVGDHPWGWKPQEVPSPTPSVLLTQPTSFLSPLAAGVMKLATWDHACDSMAIIILCVVIRLFTYTFYLPVLRRVSCSHLAWMRIPLKALSTIPGT